MSTTEPGAIVNEPVAKIIGVVLTIISVGLAILAISNLLSIVFQTVFILIALWLVLAMVQFWASSAYKGDLTMQNVVDMVIWPVGLAKSLRKGERVQNLKSSLGAQRLPREQDNSKILLPEKLTLVIGVVLTVFVILVGFSAIKSLFGVAGTAIWLLVLIYPVGLAYFFWATRYYLAGLTMTEIISLLFYPVDLVKKLAAARKYKKASA